LRADAPLVAPAVRAGGKLEIRRWHRDNSDRCRCACVTKCVPRRRFAGAHHAKSHVALTAVFAHALTAMPRVSSKKLRKFFPNARAKFICVSS
jgi:hypothetical protein